MAKREIPLFIIDTARRHKKGECDFVCCTDKDNGFIAKVDYVEGNVEEAGDDYRIGKPNGGVSIRIKIHEFIGTNPKTSEIRTLLKLCMEYYTDMVRKKINVDRPDKSECIDFLRMLIDGNMHNLNKCTPQERQTTIMSLHILESVIGYLSE